MRSRWIAAFPTLVAVALGLALLLRPARTIKPGPELALRASLPPLARAALHQRMQRHGVQLGELMLSAVLLDRDTVARIGGEIYDEPTLARPLPGDALEGQLPEQFFQSQEALRGQARHLVKAAASGASPVMMANELAELSRTCIACHDAFLREPAGLLPAAHGDASTVR
jgi:hypothetical protein